MFNIAKASITEWKKDREEIAKLFSEKKYQDSKQPILEYVNRFENALYDINSIDNKNSDESILKSLKYKPVNLIDRLSFIKAHPIQYHSYIQLNELYKEVEKILAKAEIMESKHT